MTDWMIVEKGEIVGAYTTRVLAGRIEDQGRDQLGRRSSAVNEDD